MLSRESAERLILQNKCIIRTCPLEGDENIVSRVSVPLLYRGESSDGELRIVSNILKLIPKLLESENDLIRNRVRGFMHLVLRHGNVFNEDFLHRYLFEFWNEFDHGHLGKINLEEKYFKGFGPTPSTDFHESFVAKVISGNSHIPDIVGYSSLSGGTVFIIEIKKEGIDDRALGQILRYYQRGRSVADRLRFGPSVSKVIPVLVCSEGDLSVWDAVPYYFKEVLEIFYWRMDHTGRLHLIDGKSSLRYAARERVWRSL